MNFFIKTNLSKENSIPALKEIISTIKKSGRDFSLCREDFSSFLPDGIKALPLSEGIKNCDTVITVGGDGTILKIAPEACRNKKPVLGVNTGHLGFLTAIEASEIKLLEKLINGDDFTLVKHYFLKVTINGKSAKYCLNDLAVSKNIDVNTVNFKVRVNDDPVMSFSGDGLIVATSTGSTAYSLSVGGPIVDLSLRALTVSPVAPHSLNRTSMVLDKGKTVNVDVDGYSDRPAYAYFDGGDITPLESGDRLTAKLSGKYLSVYTLKNFGQLEKVDRKLKFR